jgi:hypothetical protein
MKKSFTLIFLCLTIVGFAQSKLKVREIFDYSIGDEFQFEIFNSRSGFRNIIIDKQIFNNDSVKYSIKVENYIFNVDFSKQPPQLVYDFNYDTLNFVQADLDSFIDKVYQNQYQQDTCNIFIDSFYFSERYGVKSYNYNNHIAFKCDFEGEMYSEKFGVGLGKTYHDYRDPHGPYTFSYRMVYYKKGSIEKGNLDKAYTSGVKTKFKETEMLVVYPNPVETELHLSNNFKSPSKIRILDCYGRFLYENDIFSSSINLSFLQTGIYYYMIENNENNYLGKFIKN